MPTPRPSWGATLRLPKSAFPPRAIPTDQGKYLQRCTDDLYKWQRSAEGAKGPTFTLHDGPPYANGSLHTGHALNKILKDITCRVQLYQGRKVNYVPGWDCHGLPIELKALQRQKEKGEIDNASQLGAVAVRQAARRLAEETVEEQKAGFRGWAVMGDWDNAWKSMDKDFELRQLDVFKKLLGRGLIYQNFKPVYWSPSSHTALAEAELEYNSDHESTAAYVKFPLRDLPEHLISLVAGKSASALVWTTTPWTLLANKAIGVHQDLEYVFAESATHGVLLVAKSRLGEVEIQCKEELSSHILATVQGSELLTTTYSHPAHGKSATSQPFFHGDFVSADSGSGLVHMAPGHGMDDYKLCLKNGIEPFAPIDDQGRFTDEAFPPDPEIFKGKEVLGDGNNAVLAFLNAKGAIVSSYKYKHNYPYDWRSKQPVITRATKQWFADVGEIQESALKALEDVKFLPESGKSRLASFVKNRFEWCISRQRAWGVPIPALYEEVSGSAVLTTESVDHIIKVINERGIDSWWTDDEYDDAWVLPSLRSQGRYRRGRDTMDVWFDSGTSWTHMAKDRENTSQTADVYLEGSDQHRGWFQSSLLTKIACQTTQAGNKSEAPFKTLITHGFTLDHEGKKMSKSLGNVISPNEIMRGTLLPPLKRKKQKNQAIQDNSVKHDGMGADALRLWVAGCDYTKDIVVGVPVLKAVNSSLAKLRVTFKLLTGLLDTHNIQRRQSFESLQLIDQMALLSLQRLEGVVKDSYDAHEYHRVVSNINHYINTSFSAVYVEGIKDRMYADGTFSDSRADAQLVLWEIFIRLTRMLAPITPMLVEEACDYLPKHLQGFYHPIKSHWAPSVQNAAYQSSISGRWKNDWLEHNMPIVETINAAVKTAQESARTEKKMGSSLQSNVMLHLADDHPFFELSRESGESTCREFLLSLFVVSDVKITATGQQSVDLQDMWHYTEECEAIGHQATVTVHQPLDQKCTRCWKYTVDPHQHVEESLCNRCIDVIPRLDEEKLVGVFGPEVASMEEHRRHESIFQDQPNLLRVAENLEKARSSV